MIEMTKYLEDLEKKVYAKYTYQLLKVIEEERDGKYIVWYYHAITGDSVGFFLDENKILHEINENKILHEVKAQ
jgi:hypothetical protein